MTAKAPGFSTWVTVIEVGTGNEVKELTVPGLVRRDSSAPPKEGVAPPPPAAAKDDWQVEPTVAKHNDVIRDEHGNSAYIGFQVKCGPSRLYHSGDTLWHDDIVAKCRVFGPIDIAFLPINVNKPERRVAGNLNGTEAAALAKAFGARLVIPCHYDMFEFNTETPDEFVVACQRLQQPHRVMRTGEIFDVKASEK